MRRKSVKSTLAAGQADGKAEPGAQVRRRRLRLAHGVTLARMFGMRAWHTGSVG